ncbi:MAG: cell division protein SepF [Candidatus Aenigmarchaeota archaeon]|nr:cell division protein SepF [Candidatus Aenigmarchaeota archaeon]
MVFKSIFRREEPEEEKEEFIEIEPEGEDKRKINVRIENLNDYRDVEGIQKLMREGNIVFLRMRKLRERDLGELKRSVERLRRTSIAMNGDIIGIDEDYLVLTPSFAKIYRGEAQQAK